MLAAAQCKKPKDDEGRYEDRQILEIINLIISPHNRPFTGLCFPQAWDPARPLILEGNEDVPLRRLYDIPVDCGCEYEIPALKNLPKPKTDKKAGNKNNNDT